MKETFGATLILLLSTSIPFAASEEAFIPTPHPSDWVWDGHVGFDWSERADTTHVQLDALNPVNAVDLDVIETPSLDLEVTGLEPGQDLRIEGIAGEVVSFPTKVYPSGTLVLWAIPASPGSISVLDAQDGALMTFILLEGGASTQAEDPVPPNPQCCYHYPGPNAKPPRSIESIAGTAYVALNGAVSTASEVTVSVTNCWKHVNTISAKATGGQALRATAGGSYTWTARVCTDITSKGLGQLGVSTTPFHGDRFSDNSKKVWATGNPSGYGSISWSWTPPRCCRNYIIENAQTNGPQGFSLQEATSGAVTFTGAFDFWGVKGEATTASTTDNEALVRFSFAPNDDARHTYTWDVITGDGAASGMVGWVYKDS